jgi:hypothetical protein
MFRNKIMSKQIVLSNRAKLLLTDWSATVSVAMSARARKSALSCFALKASEDDCAPVFWSRLFLLTYLLTVILLFSFESFGQKTAPKPAPKQAPNANLPISLDERIKAALADFRGNAWIYAKNLDNGKIYEFRADERVRTASTIKLAIMVEVFAQVEAGRLKWADKFVLKNKQAGSGILGEFSDGTEIDLKTLVNLMIVVSDNTATNLILDKITSDAVNARMEQLGFQNIRSLRKIGGGGDAKIAGEGINRLFGIGVSTASGAVFWTQRPSLQNPARSTD